MFGRKKTNQTTPSNLVQYNKRWTPADIWCVTFDRTKPGYNAAEVDEFLNQAATSLEKGTLRAEDILNVRFGKAKAGYDIKQVDYMLYVLMSQL